MFFKTYKCNIIRSLLTNAQTHEKEAGDDGAFRDAWFLSLVVVIGLARDAEASWLWPREVKTRVG